MLIDLNVVDPLDPVEAAPTGTKAHPTSVISTDFFDSDYAALDLAATDLTSPPAWVRERNVSDPQMNAATRADETEQARAIYEKHGYWTTVGLAITCWAFVASLHQSDEPAAKTADNSSSRHLHTLRDHPRHSNISYRFVSPGDGQCNAVRVISGSDPQDQLAN